MRLIDADSLKTVMCVSVCGFVQPQLCTCGCAQALAIDNAPTIETEPIRHGHWEIKKVWSPAFPPIERPFCSLCGGQGSTSYPYGYCPYCGAKMDEVSE